MAMSYKIIPKPAKESLPKYPCLKSREDSKGFLIVLFTQEGQGIVVGPSGEYQLGFHSDKWCDAHFNLFDGTVTLENK